MSMISNVQISISLIVFMRATARNAETMVVFVGKFPLSVLRLGLHKLYAVNYPKTSYKHLHKQPLQIIASSENLHKPPNGGSQVHNGSHC